MPFRGFFIGSLLVCTCLVVAPRGIAQADDIDVPACVEIRKETPHQGYGYSHVVVLKSECEAAQRCLVGSDTSPSQTVRLAAGATRDIVLRRGSPARVFEAQVRCQPE